MVLEATVLIADNSEWMRNGDYAPTRLAAQNDALTFVFNAKTQSNPESTVGLIQMAGKSPAVLVTLTNDIGKILTAVHHITVNGAANINTSVQIAQLVLKHRENKNQRQRIVLFVGSPIQEDEATLVKLAKKLKKNSIAVDVVNFGHEAENTERLQAFIDAVNNSDNSHLVSIPPGPHVISDILLSSPIISGEDGPPPGLTSASNYEFGVDPNLDPELALVLYNLIQALRISMEEERARQGGDAEPSSSVSAVGGTTEDDLLAQALAMSLQEAQIELMQDVEMSEALQAVPIDLSSVLGNLPGVNPDDERIKNALDQDKKKRKDDEKK